MHTYLCRFLNNPCCKGHNYISATSHEEAAKKFRDLHSLVLKFGSAVRVDGDSKVIDYD